MESDAIVSRHGMAYSTANCPTATTEPIETIPQTPLSGVAARVIPIDTRARSFPLSADEEQKLARIARDRANRFMVSAVDVDFLLDVIVRLSR